MVRTRKNGSLEREKRRLASRYNVLETRNELCTSRKLRLSFRNRIMNAKVLPIELDVSRIISRKSGVFLSFIILLLG
jgi:hypothetical protein